jgi:hypothetical protein
VWAEVSEDRLSDSKEEGVREGVAVMGVVVVVLAVEWVTNDVSTASEGEFADNFLVDEFAKRKTDFQLLEPLEEGEVGKAGGEAASTLAV